MAGSHLGSYFCTQKQGPRMGARMAGSHLGSYFGTQKQGPRMGVRMTGSHLGSYILIILVLYGKDKSKPDI
jgi:hypothetical protein